MDICEKNTSVDIQYIIDKAVMGFSSNCALQTKYYAKSNSLCSTIAMVE